MLSELGEDIEALIARHVVRGDGSEHASCVSRSMRVAVDAGGLQVIGEQLAEFGVPDPEAAALWMADDLGGWRPALAVLRRARDGAFAATPTPGSWARYLDTLRDGGRPDTWPTDADIVWDYCPYDPRGPRTRVLVVVGDPRIVCSVMHQTSPWDTNVQLGIDTPAGPCTGDLVLLDDGEWSVEPWLGHQVTLCITVASLADLPPGVVATSIVLIGYPHASVRDGQLVLGRQVEAVRGAVQGSQYSPRTGRMRRLAGSYAGIALTDE